MGYKKRDKRYLVRVNFTKQTENKTMCIINKLNCVFFLKISYLIINGFLNWNWTKPSAPYSHVHKKIRLKPMLCYKRFTILKYSAAKISFIPSYRQKNVFSITTKLVATKTWKFDSIQSKVSFTTFYYKN